MLNDILSRVARVGAMHAGSQPAPPAERPQPCHGKPPTSPGKTIKHASFLGALLGAVAGALVAAAAFAVAAAAVAVTVAAIVAVTGFTGGLGLVLVVGAVKLAAGFGLTYLLKDQIAAISGGVAAMVDSVTPPFGPVVTGSSNVFVEKLPASRAEVDTVACTKHNSPQLIAQGSDTVYVNEHAAARIDDKTVCGGTLKEGASTVYFGAGQQTLLAIQDEFSWWEKAILIAVEFLVPPSKGLFKGLGKLFTHPRAVLRGMYAGALMTARELKRIAGCASRAFRESKGLARVKESIRAFLKDPVYIASGEVIESRQDIALGQTLPLVFERTYRTASSHTGLLGHGWHDSWSEVARVSQEGLNTHVVITLAQGFDIDFTFHQDIQVVFCPLYPEFTLYRRGAGFSLWHRDSQTWREFRAAHGDTRLLSEIRDTHDNHIALLRDGQGRLQQVRHSDGIEIRLVWQGEFVHQLIRTDGAQHTELALYRQDELGRLMEADATQLYHLYYEYDAANRLTRWHDHDQTWARYEYDEQGRCVFTTCADGFLTGRFEYYPNRVIMTDGQGHRSEYGFNALSLMSYQRSPLGHETRYEYDEHGNLLREISPQGRVTAFSYLEQTGLVSTFTDGSDQVWAYDYDEQERLCGVTDPLGRTWAWEYDSAGDPVQLTGPDASEVHFTWNRYGLLTQVSDRAGEVQARLQYDHRQRLLSATDAEGRMQHLRYDPQDRVVQWLRSDGAAYKFGYRRASWRLPEQLLRPDAREEQRQYDRHNNLLSYVDGNGAMWRQSYGAFDLLRSRTDAQGRTWRYDYDPETQQLTSVTAPDGNRWQWWLDADGRVIREQDMTGTVTYYGYDEDGHCIEVRNGEGERRSFQYDGRGLLIQETSPEETVHYRYDAVGRLTEVTSSVSHVQLEYDLRDRVVREWQNGTEVRRAYDEHSVTRTLQWSEEEKEEEGLTSTFLYSRTGELKQVVLPDGAELTINHDSAGRESERRGGRFLQTREYDAMGWLTREMTGQAHDGRIQAQQTREYRYDGAGNVTGVRTNRDREGYRLDKTGRVLSVLRGGAGRTPTAETDYHYTRTGLPQEQGRLTEWEAGRLVQRDDMYYTYDRAGRLVRRQEVKPGFRAQVWHYRWDSRNQLRAVDTPSGETWFYRYDPFGRRVSKRCAERGEEVRYLWDGDQIAEVRHYRQAQPTSRRHWVYNGWELVVQQRHIAAGGWETDFVSSAQNGEPQALYDSEGELRWQAPKATLWGQRAVAKTESADPGLAFAGQLRDSESGLCYNRFRYYDPTGGGYISPDPIGLAGGVNLYAYVPNPLSWIDPLGLAGCKLTKVNAPDHDYLLRLKRSEYPQTFGHISSAIKNGHPNIVTIQRVSAKSNRKLSLKGIKTKTGADRDEWPMAMFKEGGDGASVRYIDPSDNRGAGSSIGNILSNLPDGTRVKVEVY